MENKSKFGLREIVLGATLAAGVAGLSSCNPIDVYKTIEIRNEESDLYEKYRQIDMTNLTKEEKNYLIEMHKEYGKGTIKASKLTNRMEENWVKNLTYLTGHKKFTNKDLIFIHRISPGLTEILILNKSE